MAKRKATIQTINLSTLAIEKLIQDERVFDITGASIKDLLCNYTFEIISGVGTGDSHSVKGSGLIKDDMRNAFAEFNVHMACIDDVFKHSNIEFDAIHQVKNDERTFLFTCTGFRIKGGKDNESIILIGRKFVSSAGGYIELETPRISLEDSSSYKWFYELRMAADKARREVELYKEGKYTPVEVEEPEENLKQSKLFAREEKEEKGDNAASDGPSAVIDEDFANAAL